MRLLFLILSVMTWTVESKSNVSGEGEWPFDIEVGYSCTYQKGDVRAGDTATLVLSNLGNLSIEQVEVFVKSNKSSGAGIISVVGNEQLLARKDGTFKEWTGSYDNETFHPIAMLSEYCHGINELVISVVGTENSLHIEKFSVTYQMAPAHSVTLMNGTNVYKVMSEEKGGAGILLPSLPDVDH